MSTQMIPAQTTAIGPTNGAVEGLEDLDSRDFILPRWSLIQPTSKKDGADEHVGQFMRNLDGAFREHLDVVILKVSPSRLLWTGDLADKRPECFSRDGKEGSIYGACGQCQFNPQVNRQLLDELKAGNTTLKACGYGYTYVLVDDQETGSLALLGAMGTSVRPAKILNSQFQMEHRSPFSCVVRIASEKQTNDRGKFYVLKPSIIEKLDAERTAVWRARYQELAGRVVKDIDEEPAGSDDSNIPF